MRVKLAFKNYVVILKEKLMSIIIEDVLKLPKEDKIKLYKALQEDLEPNENVLREDELTPEQWKEINKRAKEIESGKATLISRQELNDFLKERRNALYAEKR